MFSVYNPPAAGSAAVGRPSIFYKLFPVILLWFPSLWLSMVSTTRSPPPPPLQPRKLAIGPLFCILFVESELGNERLSLVSTTRSPPPPLQPRKLALGPLFCKPFVKSELMQVSGLLDRRVFLRRMFTRPQGRHRPPSTKKLGDLDVGSAPVNRLVTLIHLFPFLLLLFPDLWLATVSTTRTPPPPLQPSYLAIWPRFTHIVREVGEVGTRSSKQWIMGSIEDTLEDFDGVSKGKYTIGLGQDCMAFCSEVEDVISMGLTAVTSLLEKYEIDPKQIGRLEVGSETVIDKSKSIKTFLMDIFEEFGNTDIEGVDSTNACYGGTAALFNCVNWVESNSWDGRYGLVVCTDSAVYAEGPARPTGGAAAIAMLIGPDAPIAFESKLRASHMSHVYDFYKPDLASEYPVVDGKLSQTCYLMALESCYKRYCQKYEKLEGKQFSIADAEYFVFHSPYNKLVQKSFARLVFSDVARNASSVEESAKEKLGQFTSLTGDESYQNRDLEKASQQVAKPHYDKKVQPGTLINKQVGNMYTASIYAAFASLIHNKNSSLDGNRVMMFSYGSGLSATMFSLHLSEGKSPFSLSNIAKVMDVDEKLKRRTELPPLEFVELMKVMEHRYGGKDFVTSKDTTLLAPGTYYLTHVDSKYRRFYAKKTTELANGH